MTGVGLALSSLRHRRVRTIFIVLSVGIAIAILTVTGAVLTTSAGFSKQALGVDELLVQPMSRARHFPITVVDQIRKIPDAKPAFWVSVYKSGDGARFTFNVLGANDDYPEAVRGGWYDTAPEDADAWRRDKRGVLVGHQTAETMGWKVGDTVTVKVFRGSIDQGLSAASQNRDAAGEVTVKVIGLSKSGFQTTHVVAHYDYLAEQFQAQTVDNIDVRCTPGKCPEVADAIVARFANSTEPAQATQMGALFERRLKQVSAVPELLSRVALLILLITGFITANTVAMSLTERRSELATLRAIGYTRGRIVRLILVESALVCGLGGLVGAGVPLLVFHHHGITLGSWAMQNVTVNETVAAAGLGCAVLLGLIAGLVPALAASRRDVVQAMASQ